MEIGGGTNYLNDEEWEELLNTYRNGGVTNHLKEWEELLTT